MGDDKIDVLVFHEKHGDRLVRKSPANILTVVEERFTEGWYCNYDSGDPATQYEDRARKIVADSDPQGAWELLLDARDGEYEGFEEQSV